MTSKGKRLRSRYKKGKKVKGVHHETGEEGKWRKTQTKRTRVRPEVLDDDACDPQSTP